MIFGTFSCFVSHFLWQFLIPPFIELFQNLQTFIFFDSTFVREFRNIENRATSSESIVKLSKENIGYFDKIQGISTHNARLDSDKQSQCAEININILLFQLGYAIDFTVSTCIFVLICEIVTANHNLFVVINEDTSDRNFLFFDCLLGLFESQIHKIINLLLSETTLGHDLALGFIIK